ncbi:lysophospholipase [Xenococcus sp. PCC 7305]|uniref:alpha/beta hydrolase n=1 Tax=Xenococcus sp. PCC 7305 TaxID=102125 RepID=UPI0002ACD3B0|nr:alpha/beta hydrolase [Xenococcus sp. PCC 7305]ELS03697.1 lysophospholipase [Xenococcus sp. PCC 7305]
MNKISQNLTRESFRHQEGKFIGADGLQLYYQSWHPQTTTKAIVIIVHGLGVHSGIFDNIVEFLVPHNYGVYGFDLRGHGRSPGRRGYINSWSEFREDLHALVQLVSQQESSLPIFLLGQSLGGTISLDYALRLQEQLQGLILFSPALRVGLSPLKIGIGRILSKLWPRFSLDTGIRLITSSRDTKLIKALAEDPLRHTKGTARLSTEFIQTVAWIESNTNILQIPLLILHGGADQIALPESSQQLFEKITFADKERRLYPDSYHVLHNDLNYQEVLTDLVSWLGKHFVMRG